MGARGISRIPMAVITAVRGSSNKPAKKPAKEYLLKKKSDSGRETREADRLAHNNSLINVGIFLNLRERGRKILLPVTIAAVRVKVKIKPGSKNWAGLKNSRISPQNDIILKIFISK